MWGDSAVLPGPGGSVWSEGVCDEMHVVFECQALQSTREDYSHLFCGEGQTMLQFMWQPDLLSVASMVSDMLDFLLAVDWCSWAWTLALLVLLDCLNWWRHQCGSPNQPLMAGKGVVIFFFLSIILAYQQLSSSMEFWGPDYLCTFTY